jgi:hypothetical protein
VRPYSKSFPTVLAIHGMFLAAVLLFETGILITYTVLPQWIIVEREVEGVHFSLAGVLGALSHFWWPWGWSATSSF